MPNTPRPLPTDESFFDLGGHYILPTRLMFEIRKVFVVDAPLGLIFGKPTISGLSGAVDALRNADFIGHKDLSPLSLLFSNPKRWFLQQSSMVRLHQSIGETAALLPINSR